MLRLHSPASPSPLARGGSVRPVSRGVGGGGGGAPASSAQVEPERSASRQLVLDALETPPRLRTDLDLAVLQHYLSSLEAFASVSPAALHYLSTECSIKQILDGEVLCYQEDPIDVESCAFVVIEGSLCGYYNKAFAQRTNVQINFTTWNEKQTKSQGLFVEFGELQTTYRKEDLCCFDDFFLADKTSSSSGISRFFRRKGIHAQEHSVLLTFARDSLERAVYRFELQYHQSQLSSPEATGKLLAYSYLAPLGLLSIREYGSLLQKAPKERLDVSSLLFSSRDGELSRAEVGVVIVLQGRLDIHMWIEGEPSREARTIDAERESETRFPPVSREKSLSASDRAPVIASVRRGQSFGDQTIALGHCSLWSSTFGAPPPPSRVGTTFRVLVKEPGTEVVWISRTLYEKHLCDDRLRFAYVPCALLESSSAAVVTRVSTQIWEDMATSTGMSAPRAVGLKRDARQVGRLGRSLMADTGLSSFFFQFSPLVIERLCSCLSVRHISPGDKARVVQPGDSIQFVMVVIRGHLEIHRSDNPAATASTSSRFSKLHGTSGPPPSDAALDWYQRDRLVPGDAFGALELSSGRTTSLHAVDAATDTLLLCIPQLVFRRWVAPTDSELIFTPGTVLTKLATASSPSKMARSDFRKLSATVARRSSYKLPSPSRSAGSQVPSVLPPLSDEISTLLDRLGVLNTLPRFLASQLLPFAVLVRKHAGELLFQETDEKQVLVTVMSGFVSIYSREHMTSAVEMLHNHPFCRFSDFYGSHTNPDEYAETMSLDDDDAIESSSTSCDHTATQHSPSKHPHRSATHGLHIQTLAPLSAFRTGVLQDGRVCPGTVVAQTDCEYLVFDEGVYSHILENHSPVIDLRGVSTPRSTPTKVGGDGGTSEGTGSNAQTSTTTVSKCLEDSAAPWLRLSAPKKQLVIRSMRQVVLLPGQQLISVGDRINELVVVVAGNLSLFVRQNQELVSMLNARQHSMKSITLERSVASNYSTTSQQLYSDDDREGGGASVLATRPGGSRSGESFAIRRQLSRITRETQPSASGILVDSVLAAVEEEKFHRQSARLSGPPLPSANGQQLVAPLLHSAIHRASIDRKLSIQRNGRRHSRYTDHHQGRHHRALFLCHFGPGDTFGEDALTPSGSCRRSKHDVFAESLSSSTCGEHGRVELLCLDRRVYLSILAKTDEEADCELRMRSTTVRSKWKRAGKGAAAAKRFQPGDAVVTERENSRPAQTATPKLLTLFQNLVNQRYHLTSRAIAAIPLLRDLPDSAKREICLVAKFEALDRRSNINALYTGGHGSSSKQSESPFFILLSGRVALVGRSAHTYPSTSGAVAVLGGSGAADSSAWLREVAVGDGFGEFDIFVPGTMPCVHPVAVEPSKMLSIPAPMFVKYWPRARQMKESIEYLRSGVSIFADLALDRLAYLYQIVEFRSFTRGETVFDLTSDTFRTSFVDKMCLIKSGTCCIRRYLSVPSPVTVDDSEVSPWMAINSTARSVRVKATIADVSAGHFFWIQTDTHPFTLESVSAAVTVAIFPIDRLKSILPRANLSQLDVQRNEMEVLHHSQLRLAHQATAALVKEKEAAASAAAKLAARANAIEDATSPTSVPAFTTRSLPLMSSRARAEASDRCVPLSPQFPSADSPEKSLSLTQPKSIALSKPHALPPFFSADVRRPCHQLEHYCPESEMLALAGSFTTDAPAIRGDPLPLRDAPKQDEVSRAESASPSGSRPASGTAHKRSNKGDRTLKPLQLSFNVSIPRVPDDSSALAVSGLAASCRPHTPRAVTSKLPSCAPTASWRLSSGSATADNTVTIEAIHQSHSQASFHDEFGQDDGSLEVLEVDLRIRVAAKLSDVGSPLRMIPLVPCKPGERSIAGSNIESVAFIPSLCHDSRSEEVAELFSCSVPHPALKGRGHQRRTTIPKRLRDPASERLCQPELVRKQGFLAVVDAKPSASDSRRAPTGCRRFYMLVGNELREFPDTVVLHNLPNECWTNNYMLQSTSKVIDVTDRALSVPERVRAQTFVLVVDCHTSIVFTAPSAMERKQWMAALSEVCSFVLDSTGGSPYPRIKQVQPPVESGLSAATSSPRTRKRTTVVAPDNNTEEEDAMPVEYCISRL